MKLILELSKENLALAKAEAEALAGKKSKLIDSLLFTETRAKPKLLAERLAYTNKIFLFLFEANERNLKRKIAEFDWQKEYARDFSVSTHKINNFSARELAGIIWRKLKNPKVNLEDAKIKIFFLSAGKKIFAALQLCEIKKDFLQRKAHKKPELHPTSLNPKLAKAMINLTGIKKGTIYDPFCGSAGILIEASFMNLHPVGYDISDFMLKKAKENFKFYRLKNYELIQDDATKIKHKMNFIVTDLPYARNSQITTELEKLYFNFLKNAKFNVAVIGFPDFIDYRRIIKKAKREVENEFTIYLHKSLSKKIVVIQ